MSNGVCPPLQCQTGWLRCLRPLSSTGPCLPAPPHPPPAPGPSAYRLVLPCGRNGATCSPDKLRGGAGTPQAVGTSAFLTQSGSSWVVTSRPVASWTKVSPYLWSVWSSGIRDNIPVNVSRIFIPRPRQAHPQHQAQSGARVAISSLRPSPCAECPR